MTKSDKKPMLENIYSRIVSVSHGTKVFTKQKTPKRSFLNLTKRNITLLCVAILSSYFCESMRLFK